MDDPYNLQRFVNAQQQVFGRACGGTAAGTKAKPLDVVHFSAN